MALPTSPESFIATLRPCPASASRGQTCNICLDEEWNASHVAVQLPCGHVFGHHCIERWANAIAASANLCPTCRAELFPQSAAHRQNQLRREVEEAVQVAMEEEGARGFPDGIPGQRYQDYIPGISGPTYAVDIPRRIPRDLPDMLEEVRPARRLQDEEFDPFHAPDIERLRRSHDDDGRVVMSRSGPNFHMAFVSSGGPFNAGRRGHRHEDMFDDELDPFDAPDIDHLGRPSPPRDGRREPRRSRHDEFDPFEAEDIDHLGRPSSPRHNRHGRHSPPTHRYPSVSPPPPRHGRGGRHTDPHNDISLLPPGLSSIRPPHRVPSPPLRHVRRGGRVNREAIARAAAAREPAGRVAAAAEHASPAQQAERQRVALAVERQEERRRAARDREAAIMRPAGHVLGGRNPPPGGNAHGDLERRFGNMSVNENSRGGGRREALPDRSNSNARRPVQPNNSGTDNAQLLRGQFSEGDRLWAELINHPSADDFFGPLWSTVYDSVRGRYIDANRSITPRLRVRLLRTLDGVLDRARNRHPDASIFRGYFNLVREALGRARDGVPKEDEPNNFIIRHLIRTIVTMTRVSVVIPQHAVAQATFFADVVDAVGDQGLNWDSLNGAVDRLQPADTEVLQLLGLIISVSPVSELVNALGSGFRGQPSQTLIRRCARVRARQGAQQQAFDRINSLDDGILDAFRGN
jgi:hypothetical protein